MFLWHFGYIYCERTEISKKSLICHSKYTEIRVYKPRASSKRINKNLCPWGLQRVRSTRGREKIAEWVGLSLRWGGGKDSESLTSSAAPSKTWRLSYELESLEPEWKRANAGGSVWLLGWRAMRHRRRKVGEQGARRQRQLMPWCSRQEEHVASIPAGGGTLQGAAVVSLGLLHSHSFT